MKKRIITDRRTSVNNDPPEGFHVFCRDKSMNSRSRSPHHRRLAVAPRQQADSARAQSLAGDLLLPSCPSLADDCDYDALLVVDADHLELRIPSSRSGPVMVDFSSKGLLWRLRKGGGLRQGIARAVGLKPGHKPSVIDATAGLGEDAFVLASLGCNVHLLERSPVIYALLEDGLCRAKKTADLSGIIERLHLVKGDSIELLGRKNALPPADVVYLDPMYPETGRTAGAKKEMQFLRAVVGDDTDAASLLEVALIKAAKRVVVKRPRLAPAIDGPPPSCTVKGKSSRFDIYLR
jgi:16S rRNA (guanine1516-N2)-methyltransferase